MDLNQILKHSLLSGHELVSFLRSCVQRSKCVKCVVCHVQTIMDNMHSLWSGLISVTSLIWSDWRVSKCVQINSDNTLKNKMLMFDI